MLEASHAHNRQDECYAFSLDALAPLLPKPRKPARRICDVSRDTSQIPEDRRWGGGVTSSSAAGGRQPGGPHPPARPLRAKLRLRRAAGQAKPRRHAASGRRHKTRGPRASFQPANHPPRVSMQRHVARHVARAPAHRQPSCCFALAEGGRVRGYNAPSCPPASLSLATPHSSSRERPRCPNRSRSGRDRRGGGTNGNPWPLRPVVVEETG